MEAPKSYFRIPNGKVPVDPRTMSPSVYGLYTQLLTVKTREDVEKICRDEIEHPIKFRFDSAKNQTLVFCKNWKQCHCEVGFLVNFTELNASGHPTVYGYASKHADVEEKTTQSAPVRTENQFTRAGSCAGAKMNRPQTDYFQFRAGVMAEFKMNFEKRFEIFEREIRHSVS